MSVLNILINCLVAILILLSGACFLLWLWFQYKFSYWNKRNITGPKPTFPTGNLGYIAIGKTNMNLYIKDLYVKYKGLPFVGAFTFYNPLIVVNDLNVIKNILVKDFDHFNSHGMAANENDNLSHNLFNLEGAEWKKTRSNLSPTFTSGKMKNMYNIMQDVSKKLEDYVESLALNEEDIDFKEVSAKYTTDVIVNCAFGIDCNSFENSGTNFRNAWMNIDESQSTIGNFLRLIHFFTPEVFMKMNLSVDKPEFENFFIKMVSSTIEHREKNNVQRNDFMDLMIKLKNNQLTDDTDNLVSITNSDLSINQIASQVFLFFIAGFETSSNTVSFALYELALNPIIQEKTRNSILDILDQHDGKFTYEAVLQMQYLDNVIHETLRKYPPLGMIFRRCQKTYKVPDHDLTIDKGTLVFISSLGLQMDPEYFPDPEKFDPDRFLPEMKSGRPSYVYMPFGEGPRICLGQRFGMMQTRLALVKLLAKYEVSICERTHIPMQYGTYGIGLGSKNGIWLKVKLLEHHK